MESGTFESIIQIKINSSSRKKKQTGNKSNVHLYLGPDKKALIIINEVK
jgi:hypothetical protein